MTRWTWYNRTGEFANGIKWFRLGDGKGWGLWWRDSRIADWDVNDAPGRKLHFGPYRVRVLRPERPARD